MSEQSESLLPDGDCVIDVDKLIFLVQSRPEIYNITLKEHHNQDVTNKLWLEISAELNVPVPTCKQKWYNLRSSYGRYLRDLKKCPSGSAGTKKQWHLAEAMSFLQQYVGPYKKTTSNLKSPPTARDESDFTLEDASEEAVDGPGDSVAVPAQLQEVTNQEEINPRKKVKQSASELLVEPMSAFLKARTIQKPVEKEDEALLFLKSIHSDMKSLAPRRQRQFKFFVIDKLNRLLDEQDEELSSASSRPIPAASPFSSSSHQSTSSGSGQYMNQPQTQFNLVHEHRRPSNEFLPINYDFDV